MKKNRKFTSAKRIISIVLTLTLMFSVFSVCASAAKLRMLDLAFVVDTTGSMEDDIAQVEHDMKEYLADLKDSGLDYRFAIVDYRDFASRTDDSDDYPYCVQLDFTNEEEKIVEAIDGLTLGNGGDNNETVFSALIDGLSELSWRSGAGKAAILMGDAPALDPEPITGYTKDMAVNKLVYDDTGYEEHDYSKTAVSTFAASQAKAASRSKVTLFTIATSEYYETTDCFEYLANCTGGKSFVAEDSAEISEIITEIIDEIPDVVEDNSISFWEFIKIIFRTFWYIITLQWDKI